MSGTQPPNSTLNTRMIALEHAVRVSVAADLADAVAIVEDAKAFDAFLSQGSNSPEALAEAWERGHFYCAAEAEDERCANPYTSA